MARPKVGDEREPLFSGVRDFEFGRRGIRAAAIALRSKVAELPPLAVRVTEHRLHRVCCSECATVTTAAAPVETRWAFARRLQAAIVTLAIRNRVTSRATIELARELFGVEIATGSVDAIVQRAGEALAAPHTRLEQEIKRSPVVNIDETRVEDRRQATVYATASQVVQYSVGAHRRAHSNRGPLHYE